MPIYCLGISVSHNGSAVLLRDGEVVAAIEKERVTRIKHHGGDETPAVDYCLETAGIGMSDVDLVVQNWFTPTVRGHGGAGQRYIGKDQEMIFGADPDRLYAQVRRPVVQISHHLAHAWSAFGPSGFEEAAVLVLDQCGNHRRDLTDWDPGSPTDADWLHREVCSTHHATSNKLATLRKVLSPLASKFTLGHSLFMSTHGVGSMYAAVTRYCFDIFEDESGKVMALAPFGRGQLDDTDLVLFPDGEPLIADPSFEWTARFRRPYDLDANQREYEFLCASAQRELERVVLTQARRLRKQSGARRLCYAGGVALNCVANTRLLSESGFDEIYVQPAANDAGVAMGCAMYGWRAVLGGQRRPMVTTSRFGRAYSAEGMARAIDAHPLLKRTRPSDLADEVGGRLSAGQIVGWYQGRSEWGPRALGQRSVLADPRRPEMHDRLTAQVKRRPDFQPYAPSILAEHCAEWFDLEHASPFMLFAPTVRPDRAARIPAVLHIDKSARVQTVTEELGPYRAVIEAFHARTEVPMVLNTSMNVKGEPMVESPEQAVAWFIATGVDALALGPWLVTRREVSDDEFFSLHPVLAPDCTLTRSSSMQQGTVVHRATLASRFYYRDRFDLRPHLVELIERCDGSCGVSDLVQHARHRNPLVPQRRVAERVRSLLETLHQARLLDFRHPES